MSHKKPLDNIHNALKPNKKAIAKMLKTSPDKLVEFESAYKSSILQDDAPSDNFFDINSKQASIIVRTASLPEEIDLEYIEKITNRIVDELLQIEDGYMRSSNMNADFFVSNEDLIKIPEELRPQLTGTMLKADITSNTGLYLLDMLNSSLESKDQKKSLALYHLFRQGLDILDLDHITTTSAEKAHYFSGGMRGGN